MTLRALALPVLVLAACGEVPPPSPAEDSPSAVAQAKAPQASTAPANALATVNLACSPGFAVDRGTCAQLWPVTLTGAGALSSPERLYAGAGEQPVLRVFVDPALLSVTPRVHLEVDVDAPSRPVVASAELTFAQRNALGTYFEYPLETRALPEGGYVARAWLEDAAGAAPATATSQDLGLTVDRTPPQAALELQGFPAGAAPVPRDFVLDASLGATGHAGLSVVSLSLAALGPFMAPKEGLRASSWVEFATGSPGPTPTDVVGAEALVSGDAIPDDTVGLNDDAHGVLLRALAVDVLGNVGSAEVRIPVE